MGTARPWIVVMLCLALAAPAAADEHPAMDIAARVVAAPGDAAVAARALKDVDALIAQDGKDALSHYARGMVLSRLDRLADAVAAYDTSFGLDRTLADASYNAGVILARQVRTQDAARRFEAALAADPKHVDAAYNLGQARYDLKQFAPALDAWTTARALSPRDFGTAKKQLQALNALGRTRDAAKMRLEAIALWKGSTDPGIRRLTSFVFDQFTVAGWYVYASETLPPAPTGVVYTFQLTAPGDLPRGKVVVEATKGKPFALALVHEDGTRKPLKARWKKLPAGPDLRKAVGKVITADVGAYKP